MILWNGFTIGIRSIPLCLAGLLRAERYRQLVWRSNKIGIVVEAAGVENFHSL